MNAALVNRLALLIVSLGTALPTSAPGAQIKARAYALPVSFKASIGGFDGTTYRVELQQGTLLYFAANVSQRVVPARVTPTVEQWREFRRSLDDINVWQWGSNYPSPGVWDGTQWSLDIRYHDRALKTQGNNNFPGRAGKPSGSPEPTMPFSAYTAAVKTLLGGKEFH